MRTAFPALLPTCPNTDINPHRTPDAFHCCCLQLQTLQLRLDLGEMIKYLCCYSSSITSLSQSHLTSHPQHQRNSTLCWVAQPLRAHQGVPEPTCTCGTIREPRAAQPWWAAPTPPAQHGFFTRSCHQCPFPQQQEGQTLAPVPHPSDTEQRLKPNCLQVFMQNLPVRTFPAPQIWK